MMDTSRLAHPKGKPASLVRKAVKLARALLDERESREVKVRSGGRCEVWQDDKVIRCRHRASHVHHMIGGRMRGRGISALADHKQAACDLCHRQITGTIGGKGLLREGGETPWWTDRYRRVK